MRTFINSRTRFVVTVSLASIVLLSASIALAAITFVDKRTAHSVDVIITQVTIARPSVSSGNLMIAVLAVNGGAAATTTPPSGWTLVSRTDNDVNVSLLTYYKVAGGSEPSDYTWSFGDQTTAEGDIIVYSGIEGTSPIDVFGAGNSGFNTSATTTATTTNAANEIVLNIYATNIGKNQDAGDYFSTPTGATERYDTSNTPFGPSLAIFEKSQAVAGSTGIATSTITTNQSRHWVSQVITLRQTGATIDSFNSYSDGDLTGENGGSGWSGAWSGSTDFDVQGATTTEGAKAVVINIPSGQEADMERSFASKTSGVLHWAQRKDAPDHANQVSLRSGSTLAMYIQIGSGSPTWTMGDGASAFNIQSYTVGEWDTVDLEFDTATDKYRVKIDNGTYTGWKDFVNPVSSIDSLRMNIQASGNDVGNNYWDDIYFDN